MKTNKKFLAMLMALIMCFSFNATVFADSEVPAGVERHTITIEVPAAEESSGIQPWIWGNTAPTVNPSGSLDTADFQIPDRYFAYEMTATDVNNNAISGNFRVDLYNKLVNSSVVSVVHNVDGTTLKKDWITVDAGDMYFFRITNFTSAFITVSLTYYSWA